MTSLATYLLKPNYFCRCSDI